MGNGPSAVRESATIVGVDPRRVEGLVVPLSDCPVRASIAVSDIGRAIAFYEGRLGLKALESGPSATIPDGSRVYACGDGPGLNVYKSDTAAESSATLA